VSEAKHVLHDPKAWLLAEGMRATARACRPYTGYGTPSDRLVIDRCKRGHRQSGSVLIFTRDEGMHSSGWWKNPDYEQCWHLSISFVDPETLELAPHDHAAAARWCELFFKHNRRLLWIEPPYSPTGVKHNVWHYRLFVDPTFTVPLLPRGDGDPAKETQRW